MNPNLRQVLRPAINGQDGLPGQPGAETVRERRAQIGAPHDDAHEALPRHDGFEAPADGFDFGEFGHRYLKA